MARARAAAPGYGVARRPHASAGGCAGTTAAAIDARLVADASGAIDTPATTRGGQRVGHASHRAVATVARRAVCVVAPRRAAAIALHGAARIVQAAHRDRSTASRPANMTGLHSAATRRPSATGAICDVTRMGTRGAVALLLFARRHVGRALVLRVGAGGRRHAGRAGGVDDLARRAARRGRAPLAGLRHGAV